MRDRRTLRGSYRTTVGVFACTVMLMSVVHASTAATQDKPTAARPFAEYVHRSYTSSDGAPNEVTALAQTRDGFLWLGSPTGLVRFDGVAFDASVGKQLPSPNVYALYADDDDLWIGYGFGGISRLRHGQLTNYDMKGLPSGSVNGFARRPDGVLWAATTKGLMRLVDGQWQPVGDSAGFAGHHVVWMQQVRGILWVMDADAAYALDPGANRFRSVDENEARRARAQVPLNGTWQPGRYFADYRYLLTDSGGALWMGVEGGIGRDVWPAGRQQPLVDKMTPREGLTGDAVAALLQDREGNIWVGTNNGLDQFRASKFTLAPLSSSIRAPAFVTDGDDSLWAGGTNQEPVHVGRDVTPVPTMGTEVWCVARDREGGVWMAGVAGLKRWVDGRVSTLVLPDDLVKANDPDTIGGKFQAIAMDADGGVWLSVAQYDLYRFKDGVWTRHGGRQDLPKGPAIRLLADDIGRLWLTYPHNLVVMIEHGVAKRYTAADGLTVGNVQAVHVRGAQVWVAGDLGVARLEHERFVALVGAGGEAFRATTGIVETPTGELWLDSADGVYRIGADEMRRAHADPMHAVAFELFDAQDGLQGTSQQIRPGPTLQQGSNGRLWVARLNGISWIDPPQIRRNRIAPEVLIQSLHVGDRVYLLSEGLSLPKLTRNLHFDYTAPSLSLPQRVLFRYQLEGVDSGWQEAGTRRQAFYTNLGPGSYRFRVRAANEDGVWSTHDATFDFRIAPAFYQTWWFGVLCGCLALGALWLLYLLRLGQLAARERIRGAERERIARDLHDTLLQGIQGLQLRLQTWAADKSLDPHHRDEIGQVATRTRDMVIDGRDRIIALRRVGTQDIHLIVALRAIGDDYASMYPARFTLQENGEPRVLRPEAAAEALDIVREGLRNAFVHAAAASIDLLVDWKADGLWLRVSDDGRGIDETVLREGGRAGHWGLLGMRERAARIGAQLDLHRRACGGTELSLSLPAPSVFAELHLRLWRRLRHIWKAHVN
jgi:ligand-binding sensor domain-containing protein